jgi:hypothetical protein
MKKTPKEPDLFHLTFIGEFVEILTPIYQKKIQGNEDGVVDETIPVMIQGYILDMDEDRLYLGDSPEEITQSILKVDARIIRIVKMANPYDEILDSLDPPSKKESIN